MGEANEKAKRTLSVLEENNSQVIARKFTCNLKLE
jgi:hypothetical protein